MYFSFSQMCVDCAPLLNDEAYLLGRIMFKYYNPNLKFVLDNPNDRNYLESKTKTKIDQGILWLAFSKLAPNDSTLILETKLHHCIFRKLDSLCRKYNLRIPVSEDRLHNLIAEAIKTKNLKVLEFDGLFHVDDYPLTLFASATTWDGSRFAVQRWLSWRPLLFKIRNLEASELENSSRVKESKKITLDIELKDDKLEELLNEFVEKLKSSSSEWLKVTVK